jgi:pilus assembly protein CpaB
MNKRFVGVLIFAAIVSLAFSTVFYRLLVHQSQTTKAAAATVRIVLAARDLEVGTILRDQDIKVADWPGAVPRGRLRSLRTWWGAASPRQFTRGSR